MSTETRNDEAVQTTDLKALARYDLADCPDSLVSDLYRHIVELQDDLASVSKEYHTHLDSGLRPLADPLAHLSVNVEREIEHREALEKREIVNQTRQRE